VLLLKGLPTAILVNQLTYMDNLQDQFDEATYAFSQGDYDAAAKGFEAILLVDNNHFDARMSYSMTLCRLGELDRAIQEGHKVERMRPDDQMVHTNLSLFYVKIGNKEAAEHHGLQSKIASWKQPLADESSDMSDHSELQMTKPKVESFKLPGKFPDMPWRKSQNKDETDGGEDD
jgi:tetratricopeptide (TPR) repeat protein